MARKKVFQDGAPRGYLNTVLATGPSRFGSCTSFAPRWRSPMWSAQARAEGLTLLVADNKAGYFGVYLNKPGKRKPSRRR